ncbi:MAG: SDR family oxidoreductase [Actinomycetes bacterium]
MANSLRGKTVVVTGATGGIGLATAQGLGELGASLIISGRDPDRGRKALEILRARGLRAELASFDLSSLQSTREGAASILERVDTIDVLVNNAGLILSERKITEDGLEATMATNHLGPFLLTQLLSEAVTEHGGRIVNVASTAHRSARKGVEIDELHSLPAYQAMDVYGRSKLANILFTTELARRLAPRGITANSLHPGTVATGFARDGDARGWLAYGVKLIAPFIKNATQGARCSVYLASDEAVKDVTGRYFVNCRERKPSAQAQDLVAAQKLWERSLTLCKLVEA